MQMPGYSNSRRIESFCIFFSFFFKTTEYCFRGRWIFLLIISSRYCFCLCRQCASFAFRNRALRVPVKRMFSKETLETSSLADVLKDKRPPRFANKLDSLNKLGCHRYTLTVLFGGNLVPVGTREKL